VVQQQPFFETGLRTLGGFIPAKDSELHQWLERAVATQDAMMFQYVICAAATVERKLQASLLPIGAAFVPDPLQLARIAWSMEGEVADELVKAVKTAGLSRVIKTQMLFFAAAWWVKFRRGPLPQALTTEARTLARMKPVDGYATANLSALITLAPNEALQDLVPLGRDAFMIKNSPMYRDASLRIMEQPFYYLLPDTVERGYTLGRPMRRAVEEIGRNDPCRCGSGKKYKRCCEKADLKRGSSSSDVAGKTTVELHDDPEVSLSPARLAAMPRHELVRVSQVPDELLEPYLLRLAEFKCFDNLVETFTILGVGPQYEPIWRRLFTFIVREWNRDSAERLLKTHPQPKEILPKLEPGVRLLLASTNMKKLLQQMEHEALAALQSGDPDETARFASGVLASPCPALGILVARSVLPLLNDRARAGAVFDEILHARDRLDLSPDDDFSDFMDEQALQKRGDESDELDEAQEQLGAKSAEVRRLKETLAQTQREIELREKRERREVAANVPKSNQDDEALRALKRDNDRLKVIVREANEDRLALRRKTAALGQNVDKLLAANQAENGREANDDEDAGEALVVSGQQPVRLFEFPKKFGQTVDAFPEKVGRATMSYLGQVAAGEPTAFKAVVQLKAYPTVLRKRLAGSYRLLFTLHPDRVRVVDLIARADLDRRIKKLQASGLPPLEPLA
jgi:hypothetical protein